MKFNTLKNKSIFIFLIYLIFIINYFSNDKSLVIKICICTCGKNENKYAREFVQYYLQYGVDKIFIYDNNDDSDESFADVLFDYIKSGFVEIINFRNKTKIQLKAFNHCYQLNKNNYDWFIYYDMDEFIHLHDFKNIKEYLLSRKFNKCNIIYLNHVIHTDNNQIYYYNKSLFERFPLLENYENANYSYIPRRVLKDVIKIILRENLSNIKFGNPHFLDNYLNSSCNGFGNIINHNKSIHLKNPDHSKFYFDHFYFKSSEEYLNKLTKGDAIFGNKRGFNIYWFQIYFAFNKITKEKLDYFENKTGANLTVFKDKIL